LDITEASGVPVGKGASKFALDALEKILNYRKFHQLLA
jgi:hypothetical protein